jgi:proteic killer suppression protein
MILNFKHKGLGKFFKTGSTAGIQVSHAKRLQLILGRLNAASDAKDMNLPGLRLHELSAWMGDALKKLT